MNELENLFTSPDSKIVDVIEILNLNQLKHAFIVDENKKLLGIVSDGDIRRAISRGIPLNEEIKSIMNRNPLVAKVGIKESEVLNILMNKQINIIPILDNKKRVIKYFHIKDFIKDKYLKNDFKKSFRYSPSKKILVIGGAGYVGSVLVRLLLDKGFSVRVLDKLTFGKESIKELLSKENFELIKGDYTRIEDLLPCLKNVYAVVHLAAIVGDPAGSLDPELTEEVNFHGVKILAELCKYYGIERFIFCSTCSVYGTAGDEKLTEKSKLNPVSLYAETKLKAEKTLLKLKDNNFHPCILRLATVFGLSNRMRFDLVVNILTAYAVKKKKISIYSGKQWRPLVHVKDVGRAIINVLNQPLNKISGEIFNIGSEENNFRIEDLGKLMKRIFPEINVNRVEDKEDDRSYRGSFEKAHKILEFETKYDVEDGIKEMALFLRNNNINFEKNKFSNYKNVRYGIIDSISFIE